ncbi:hypothetical protein BDW42DRAFT_161642 [Aspergillus taichungensis]|uniref:Uncharacterized protein n=1 Tax=Aspergillus taichungensis TaxID=482145 RepID=A0A2J5I597_9EURO|nr:hypothetical protein BDW42DRAFT_161642 [Aspergillus taichungensis]
MSDGWWYSLQQMAVGLANWFYYNHCAVYGLQHTLCCEPKAYYRVYLDRSRESPLSNLKISSPEDIRSTPVSTMVPVGPVSILSRSQAATKNGRMQIGLTAKTSARRRFASRDNSREKSKSGLETSAKLAPDGWLVFLRTWDLQVLCLGKCPYRLLPVNDDLCKDHY